MATSKVTTAIVRAVPNSFVQAISKLTPKVPICIDTTRLQHAKYVQALQSLDINVIELPADEEFPDSIFVEDNCVIIGTLSNFFCMCYLFLAEREENILK